jgi:hypothetical protein
VGKRIPIEIRFWSRVDETAGCWWWTAQLSAEAYGLLPMQGEDGLWRPAFAHRIGYMLLVGPIPEGLTLDHECHNQDDTCPGGRNCFHRSCVRPDHLIPRLAGPNAIRGGAHYANATHCKWGHPFDEANTYIGPNGQRWCRACRNRRAREIRARRKSA